MDSQDGRCLASYTASYTALSSIRARSNAALACGSIPPRLGVALAERSLAALHPLVGGRRGASRRPGGQAADGGPRSRTSGACRPRRAARRPGPGAAERHHGLSLEVQDHPAGRRAQYLAEMVVAVYPLHRQRAADRGQLGVVAAELVRVRAQLRAPRRWRVQLAGHLAGHVGVRLRRDLGDAERGGQVGVHLRGGRAQPERLARRSHRRPGPAGSSPGPHAVAGVQVAQAGGGQRPAVAGRRAGTCDRIASRIGSSPPLVSIHPNGSATCARAAPGQRAVHLEVRVLAGEEPAQHLQDGRLAEDQAGVALLAGQHQAVQAGVDDRARLPGEAHRADGPLLGHAAQQDLGRARGRAAPRRRSGRVRPVP